MSDDGSSGCQQIVEVRQLTVESGRFAIAETHNYLGLRWMNNAIRDLKTLHRLRARSKKTEIANGRQQGELGERARLFEVMFMLVIKFRRATMDVILLKLGSVNFRQKRFAFVSAIAKISNLRIFLELHFRFRIVVRKKKRSPVQLATQPSARNLKLPYTSSYRALFALYCCSII